MDIFVFPVLFLLTALAFAWLERNLGKSRRKKKRALAGLRLDYERLAVRAAGIRDEHARLVRSFEETVALYEITREITKHLEEEKVFSSFVERLGAYIHFTDCRYFKERLGPGYDRWLTLRLGETIVGYLACRGIEDRDADKFQIMGGQFVLGIKRAILYRRIQEMATYDSLTRVYTRRYWFERCGQEIERSRRFGYKACCLMLDIDHFKDVNDRYGHLAGDAILKEVSKIVRENIRQIDLLGRYGGEELCLLLTETDYDNGIFVAERIRQAIEQRQIRVYDEDLRVTASVGVSLFPGSGERLERLIEAADGALYRAKELGRNKVCASAVP